MENCQDCKVRHFDSGCEVICYIITIACLALTDTLALFVDLNSCLFVWVNKLYNAATPFSWSHTEQKVNFLPFLSATIQEVIFRAFPAKQVLFMYLSLSFHCSPFGGTWRAISSDWLTWTTDASALASNYQLWFR